MPTPKRLPEKGTLVTVRITDDTGTEHTYHGTFVGTCEYLTHVTDHGRGPAYTRYPDEEALRGGEMGDPSTYARIYAATGNPIERGNLPKAGPDHWFSYAEVYARLDSADVTLTKATKEGQAWVDNNQSIDNRRRALIEKITALDPKLGDATDRLMDAIDESAYDRGRTDEWRANDY